MTLDYALMSTTLDKRLGKSHYNTVGGLTHMQGLKRAGVGTPIHKNQAFDHM